MAVTSFVKFISKNPWVIGLLLICFGILGTFFGRRFLKIVLASLGFMIGFLTTMLLCSYTGMLDYLTSDRKDAKLYLVIIAFILALVIGGALGYLLIRIIRGGVKFIATIGGLFLGYMIYNLILSSFESIWLMLGVVIFTGLLMGFLAFKFFFEMICVTTALLGSYSLIRGISMFAGSYPNEIVMM